MVKKKATAYAKAVHIMICVHTEAQGLSSLTVNEFPRFISENVKHSRVLIGYFNNAKIVQTS